VSTKTTADKLLIRPNSRLWTSDPARSGVVGPLPHGVAVAERPGEAATAIAFGDDAAGVRRILDRDAEELKRTATFWVAYPKANRADINRDSLWAILADYGFRPISQVAIDEVWSALRFRPLAPGEPRFTGGR
jgi:hypothetical protein